MSGAFHSLFEIVSLSVKWREDKKVVKFLHSSILYYAFSSWIEKRMIKTIDCLRENRFVFRAVWKFYQKSNIFSNQPLNSSSSSFFDWLSDSWTEQWGSQLWFISFNMLVNLASVCYLAGFVMILARVFYLHTGLNELYIKSPWNHV